TQLLTRIELLLPLRLQVGLSLRARPIRLCLRGRRLLPLACCTQLLLLLLTCCTQLLLLLLACCTQLLSLNVSRLLNVPLLLLDAAVDHCRCLLALRRRNVRPCNRRARDVWCRHLRLSDLRSCNLRPCDLRCCNMRRGAGCNMGHRGSRRGSRGSRRGSPWRSGCRTGFSPVLCRSGYRNSEGQRGGQRHPSSQIQHCTSSTSAELRFRRST